MVGRCSRVLAASQSRRHLRIAGDFIRQKTDMPYANATRDLHEQ